MPELAPWQNAFATTGPTFMATVRQSITALYEEAQRSAVEGAPMLAVLQSDAAGPDALPDRADADGAITLPATAIAARFEQLRRLAELEAGPAAGPSETPATDVTRFDAPNDPHGSIYLSAGFGDSFQNDPADDATNAASDDVDGGDGVPAMDDSSTDIPVIDVRVTGFGTAPEDTGEPAPEKPGDATPAAQAVSGIETGPSLPEEPPAPASDNTGNDLDIADIHKLVREAWEDETAIGEIASPEAREQSADHHAEAADVAATGNIETTMQEIAAAVVRSADSGKGIDVEALKREIIAAMRAELQAVVDSDLKSLIKTAVAEAIADISAVVPPAGQAAKKVPKVTRKAPAKKAAKTTAKAAAKTAPNKVVAKKKNANGRAVDDNGS